MGLQGIDIDYDKVEQHADDTLQISDNLQSVVLLHADDRSTISASIASKAVYEDAQNLMTLLGESIEAEANKIRSLGLKFVEADQLESELIALTFENKQTLSAWDGK